MPQKTNLNVSPYNDDFDAIKNFYKILFRPGYSIQTRELTSLQSILQNQVESIGRNLFKQGDMIVPGEVGLNTALNYVKLSSVSEVAINVDGDIIFQKYDIKKLIGIPLTGLISGVVGVVISAEYGNEFESDTLFVKYVDSGNSTDEKTFRQGETLEADIENSPTLVVGTDGSVLPTTITRIDGETKETLPSFGSQAMGFASSVNVEEGIYFVNGYFVRNEKSVIVIDKYYNKPTCKVGFVISEELITPEEDTTLYDNSRGTTNYSAPGAHRLQINLELVVYNYDEPTDDNFVKLITVKNGEVEKVLKPADYNLIEETLARRTYDESGDYVVDNFSLELREYYQNNNNKGLYAKDSSTGKVNGLTELDASKKFVVGLAPGKAYVKGYEIVNKETKYLELDKARDTIDKLDNRIKIKNLPSYNITNVYGSIPLNSEGSSLTAYPTIYLNQVFTDGSLGFNNSELGAGATQTETDSNLRTYKQTTDRRGKQFTENDGIKTLYIQLNTLKAFPTDSNFGKTPSDPNENGTSSGFDKLWYIKTRGTSSTAKSVDLLAFRIVTRSDLTGASEYLELTISGEKYDVEELLREYDDGDTSLYGLKRRKLFFTESQALGDSNNFYGHIVDYNETITPIVGLAKPKNFTFIDEGTGFNSDVDKILSKGSISSGKKPYNAIFSLSYFNPVFFTKIIVDSKITSGFTSGQYIRGYDSGAYGVIENSSGGYYSPENTNILFVRTLSGSFIPGETIIDESGKSLKIAKENTISHFVVANRGSGYDLSNTTISINNTKIDKSAVSVYVDDAGQGQSILGIYKIEIKDRNLLKNEYLYPPTITAVKSVVSGTQGTGAYIIPILYRNTVTTYTTSDVKSVFSSFNEYKFSADIDITSNSYYSLKSITSFSFVGISGTKYLECVGFSGDATVDLKQGDIIQYTDSNNLVNRAIVQYATKPEGLLKSRIYLDSCLKNNVESSVIKVFAKIENSESNLLIPTGSKYVESIAKDPSNSNIKYHIRRDFIISTSNNGGNSLITFVAQLPLGTQRFTTFNKQNFIISVLSDGGSSEVDAGDILFIKDEWVQIQNVSETSGLTSGTFTLNIPSSFFGTVSNYTSLKLKLTATLEVDKAIPRIKSVIRDKKIFLNSSTDNIILLRGQDYATQTPEVLSYSDAIKINYIYEGSTTTSPVIDDSGNLITGLDITERFSFDDGQRDSFYDISRLVLKPGYPQPSGILIISFDYFEHSQGDFCTVDSYVHESGVNINQIPYFNSSALGKISLRDVIDFRPKVDTTSISSGYQNTSVLSLDDYCSFVGSGGVITNTPAPDSSIEYSIKFNLSQYLDRIDSITLNNKGEFSINPGNPSLNPVKPEDVKDALSLYYLYIPSYTDTIDDIKVTAVDNKRYTMKDIGKLEKRIERLEYYTQLSILEQQALNMQIKDEIGLDRFKSGFVVDNYENHSVGNLESVDYRCAIDSQQSVLRPQSAEYCVDLEETFTTNEFRTSSGYKNSNGIATLPFTNLSFISNNFATRTINPNPFDISGGQYVGDAFLSPSIDQWYDTTEKPIILNNDSSLYSIFFAKEITKDSLNSIHNSYLINWIGTDRTFFNVNSLSSISSVTSTSSIKSATVASSSNISPQNNELARGASKTTIGSSSVVTSLNFYARSKPVFFKLTRLKPNTKLYVFIDGKNVDRWISPDIKYTGIAGNSLSTFGASLSTDSDGNASGLLLIPSGHPPDLSSSWNGDSQLLSYDTSYEQYNLTTGIKTVRFTSSSSDDKSSSTSSFTETKYYATGILPALPASIISTTPPFFKSNEGIQFVESSASTPSPLTQTFKIENAEGGLFATGIDLFFGAKSSNLPIRVYLTNVNSGKPGKYIIPGTEVTKISNTYIRVYTNGSASLQIGEMVTGVTSGASGPLFGVRDKNNTIVTPTSNGIVTLSNNQIYTLILSNNNGISFTQNETLLIPSVIVYNNTQTSGSSPLLVTIAKDSGRITGLKLKSFGANYETANIVIESPSLVGGTAASGSVLVSNGKIFDASLLLPGSGYTQIPSVIIRGTGDGASGALVEAELTIDTPSVIMGVATDISTSGSNRSTTPTRFDFDYPVYLQNNTDYAFVVETDSNQYRLWSSKLAESDVVTGSTVNTQPLLGSVYKSQNIDNWTEDLFEDIKFTLYKARFDTSKTGILYLNNKVLGYETLPTNAIETNASQDSTATSTLFQNNNTIVKINHPSNGFENSGKSLVNFKFCQDTSGISSSVLNGSYFEVDNTGTDYYTINTGIRAGSSLKGGGSKILASYNRKYEKIYPQISCLNFSTTNVVSYLKSTNIIPHDNNSTVYTSYSQTDYERTFLNEEQYFTNQKIIPSRINDINNNIDSGLKYKIELSSTNPNLSPVIDMRFATAKLVNNLVEKSQGNENRFGRRDQIVQFYPIYSFGIANLQTYNPVNAVGQSVTGSISKASGIIVSYTSSKLYVKVKTSNTFVANDVLTFSGTGTPTGSYITSNGVELYPINFVVGSTITALSSDNISLTDRISGKIISWNSQTRTLVVSNNKNPIDDNYISGITTSPYSSARSASSTAVDASTVTDIFRVGDTLTYQGIVNGQERYVEISNISYTNGIDYVAETFSSNSSSIAKYTTKEIVLQNPSTSIDVRLTQNLFNSDDVLVFYKIKLTNTQSNFDDLNWYAFNNIGESDNVIIASADNSISGLYENQESYKEYKYSVSGLSEFTSYAIKIVMRSSNPAFVPKIQDMRAVASY
jgi:hypothetical protein